MDVVTKIIIVFYILFLTGYLLLLYKKKSFQMDAKPLTSQLLFWAAIYIPISAFLFTGYFCWQGHSVQFDANGFNTFLSISKFPLGLLSLSIPFGVVVNNIHRTIQTDSQINEAKRKNRSDLFYSHQKNIVEYFSKKINTTLSFTQRLPNNKNFNSEIKIEITNPYKLYYSMFRTAHSESDDLRVSESFRKELASSWIRLNALLDKRSLNKHTEYKTLTREYFKIVHCIELCLRKTSKLLYLSNSGTVCYYDNNYNDDFIISTMFDSATNVRILIRAYINILDDIFTISNSTLFHDDEIKNIITYIYKDEEMLSIYFGNHPPNERSEKQLWSTIHFRRTNSPPLKRPILMLKSC